MIPTSLTKRMSLEQIDNYRRFLTQKVDFSVSQMSDRKIQELRDKMQQNIDEECKTGSSDRGYLTTADRARAMKLRRSRHH